MIYKVTKQIEFNDMVFAVGSLISLNTKEAKKLKEYITEFTEMNKTFTQRRVK